MARSLLCDSATTSPTDWILKRILLAAGFGLALACVQTAALGQRVPVVGAGRGGGGRVGSPVRPVVPRPLPTAMPRPRFVGGPHFVRAGSGNFGFGVHPIHVFRHRRFLARRLFAFVPGFNFAWWPSCGPAWAWGWGFDCYPSPIYGYGFENYVTVQPYVGPAYIYGGEERDLVWLYLKDGTVLGVDDYWFVDGQMHYTTFEEGLIKPLEHVKPFDELDVQKTVFVNSRRGFRVVMRDEPWEKYLKDHPDLTPPELTAPELPPPQKNQP